MSKEERVVHPLDVTKISLDIKKARDRYLEKLNDAIIETQLFAKDAAQAIGNISISEAEQATIVFFTEQLRKIK